MKKRILFLCIVLFLACEASKKSTVITTKEKAKKTFTARQNKTVKPQKKASNKIQDIIDTAFSYNGTRYKYGGTTKNGMDCSGLVYTAFKENNIGLERSSYRMATQGKRTTLGHVKLGDLVFFITNRNRNRIDHVGLVVEVNTNTVKFIHATTSRGVLVSSLNEKYWSNAFAEVRSML